MDQESLAQIKQIVTEATEAVEGRLRQEIHQTGGQLRQEIQQTEGRLRGEIEDVKRHTGVLVEGQQAAREYMEDFRSEMQSETKETRALLRLSYQQLHQRVENLEQRVLAIEHRLGLTV
jgi:hypothetical protein